jgi:hypothetical protein
MQIPIKPVRLNQSGFILTVTVTFLLVTLIIFASIMYWVTSSARVTQQNNLFNVSEAAAQGAVETAVTAMNRDFLSQSINPASVYAAAVTNIDQTAWPVKFNFSDTNGNVNRMSVSIQPQDWSTNYQYLNAQFTGLYAAVANCDVICVATPTNTGYNMSAVVEATAQLAAIPVFQFGVFYNLDLDFSPGQPLIMNGKTHCNGIIWMYPQASATFNDVVEATVIVTNKDNPNDQQNLSSYVTPINYKILPSGNPLSGVDTISMPIAGSGTAATNVEAILNLPPTAVAAPNTAAYDPTNQIYLYNKCDLIISNSSGGLAGAYGTNITIYYQDKSQSPILYQLTNNEICTYSNRTLQNIITTTIQPLPATNFIRLASYFPFVTNVSFYDFRESDTVQALQIDIAKLATWLTNYALEGYAINQTCGGGDGAHGTKGHPIDSIFIYSSVPRTSSQLPAVRLVNGSKLPTRWGLTIATPFPIYTLGNYNVMTNIGGSLSVNTTNTAWTWPAALMGDAITILSSNWQDNVGAYAAGGAYGSRVACNTTVNTALLEGIVPSITVGGVKHYSGGLENFLRMIETWGNGTYTLTYNGSIVVMFPSIYATNFWIQPGTYYDKPIRNWGFDSNFKTPEGMPPCAPQAKAIIRGNWNSKGK